jgi:hypothetical protein
MLEYFLLRVVVLLFQPWEISKQHLVIHFSIKSKALYSQEYNELDANTLSAFSIAILAPMVI